MSEQYFSAAPTSAHNRATCEFAYRGQKLAFTTDSGVFSRGEMDFGTKTLLEALDGLHGRVLDLGCGWGAVGVSVGKAFPDCEIAMGDVNERAVALSKQNAEKNGVLAHIVLSDGLTDIQGEFDVILTNPPIRAGKQVIYRLFAQSAERLRPGGRLLLVIRKKQGADSAVKYLNTLFKAVETIDRSGGFHVIQCTKE